MNISIYVQTNVLYQSPSFRKAQMMRSLRFFLPLAMVIIAVGLTVSNFLRPGGYLRPFPRVDSSWEAPDRQICDGLNAPAALVRFCLLRGADKWLPDHPEVGFFVQTLVYFGLVGLLWYLVSLEITGIHLDRLSFITPRMGVRGLADVLLVLFGAGLGLSGELVRHQFGVVTTYFQPDGVPYFVWAIVIMLFYGRDFWISVLSSASKHA